MLIYRIEDPVRASYECYDLAQCMEKLVQTTLRAIIGDMGLDDTLASREEINRILLQKIRSVSVFC
jgi:regulator of protease activity HflC (stomatin/prohibitin superfamily)